MPILGIYASSMQPALNASSYESIATVTVGVGGSSTVSFTSIPGTYKHLQVRAFARTNYAANSDYFKMNFNSDTSTSNYINHYLYGDGASAGAANDLSNGHLYNARIGAANATTGVFGGGIMDILDYTNTNKNKTTRWLGGTDNNGNGQIWFISGLWLSTSAITRIDIAPGNGTSFNQYSSFALYGIKA